MFITVKYLHCRHKCNFMVCHFQPSCSQRSRGHVLLQKSRWIYVHSNRARKTFRCCPYTACLLFALGEWVFFFIFLLLCALFGAEILMWNFQYKLLCSKCIWFALQHRMHMLPISRHCWMVWHTQPYFTSYLKDSSYQSIN